MVIAILVSTSIIPLYSTIHSLFALQYLRASLTVPIFFERQILKDSNFTYLLPKMDTQIRNRKFCIIILQAILLISSTVCIVYFAIKWVASLTESLSERKTISKYEQLGYWAANYDWESGQKKLMVWAICLNIISLFAVLAGLILLK